MTIVRREHRAHFTIVPNAVFANTRLSVEAKGVLGYLLSRPHKWRVRLEYVGRTLKVGRKKLQRIFRELANFLVTFEPAARNDLAPFADLKEALEKLLGCPVDLVEREAIAAVGIEPSAARRRAEDFQACYAVAAADRGESGTTWPLASGETDQLTS